MQRKNIKIIGTILYMAWALLGFLMNLLLINTFEVSKLGISLIIYNAGWFMILKIIHELINEMIEFDEIINKV